MISYGAWGMGHLALSEVEGWGMGHGAWGIGHGASRPERSRRVGHGAWGMGQTGQTGHWSEGRGNIFSVSPSPCLPVSPSPHPLGLI
ncbi:hypothetical protein [Microcoleus sp. bin38.metabat.b11b12b14.051]|uniref:hypothetical protein n=1 Tax=Microcoleus sp. bin38.metabat.b11b12b14.051 TaxID=2742709 RepID=UPI0025DE75FE|nr:hypothetical protein [Microcoleus sp. bin38.metabat.b11b12b14.051]